MIPSSSPSLRAAARGAAGRLMISFFLAGVCPARPAERKSLRSAACYVPPPSPSQSWGLGGLVPVLMGRAGSWQVGPFFISRQVWSSWPHARSLLPVKNLPPSFFGPDRFRRACAHTTTRCPLASRGPPGGLLAVVQCSHME
jgi:hypothetical protein